MLSFDTTAVNVYLIAVFTVAALALVLVARRGRGPRSCATAASA